MRLPTLLAAPAVTMTCSAAASAATYTYTLTGPTASSYSATWQLDSMPIPSTANEGEGFDLERVEGSFPGSTSGAAYFNFFSAANGGGLTISDADDPDLFFVSLTDGAQLYTGSEREPVLSLGTFSFSDTSGVAGYTLQVSDAAAAVPEPATWAMMILGFAAVGGAMRTRRTVVRFA